MPDILLRSGEASPNDIRLSADTVVSLTGAAAVASAGSLTLQIGPALTGAAATASAGTFSPSLSVTLVGAAATAAAGALTPSDLKTLTGAAATASAGSLTLQIGPALTGAAATASAGALTPSDLKTLTGAAATASAGALAPSDLKTLTGAAATASAGTFSPSLSVTLVGAAAAASAGALRPMRLGSLAKTLGAISLRANGAVPIPAWTPCSPIEAGWQPACSATGTWAPPPASMGTWAPACASTGAWAPEICRSDTWVPACPVNAALHTNLDDAILSATGILPSVNADLSKTLNAAALSATGTVTTTEGWDASFNGTFNVVSQYVAQPTSASFNTIIGLLSHSTGARYFELVLDGASGANHTLGGVARNDVSPTQRLGDNNVACGSDQHCGIGYPNHGGGGDFYNIRYNASESAINMPEHAGDRIGTLVDLTAGLLWVTNYDVDPTKWYGASGASMVTSNPMADLAGQPFSSGGSAFFIAVTAVVTNITSITMIPHTGHPPTGALDWA